MVFKKILAVGLISGALLLGGCTTNSPDNSPSSSPASGSSATPTAAPSTSESKSLQDLTADERTQLKKDAAAGVKNYFDALVDGKDSATKITATSNPDIPGLSEDGKKKLFSGTSFTIIDSLSKDDQKAVVAFFEAATPATKYIYTEGLSSAERTMVALINIYTSSSAGQKVDISPDEITLIDSTHAEWKNSQLNAASTANYSYPFVKTSNGWLLNGKGFMQILKEIQTKSSPSPSATK